MNNESYIFRYRWSIEHISEIINILNNSKKLILNNKDIKE